MYLGDCCLGGSMRAVSLPVRALPTWQKKSAGSAPQGYALYTPHFQPLKPKFRTPGDRYPIWSECGNQPGSGSPCNQYARRRFAELQGQGQPFATIERIMTAEGSFRHYAGF